MAKEKYNVHIQETCKIKWILSLQNLKDDLAVDLEPKNELSI